MYNLKTLAGGGACPEQYYGETISGEQIYVRIRGGNARLDINDVTVAYLDFPEDVYKGTFEGTELAELLLTNFAPDRNLIDFLHRYYRHTL